MFWNNPLLSPNQDADADRVEGVLRSLTVGKGGRGQSKEIAPDWSIGFYENPDRDNKEQPFVLVLRHRNGRESKVGLKWADVFTKSKSQWRRDSVWRLTPETAKRLAASIASVMRDPRARPSLSTNPRKKQQPKVHRLEFAGYEFISSPEGTVIKREPIVATQAGEDYGADPMGDGTFRMVPSGDIVSSEEKERRLARFRRR